MWKSFFSLFKRAITLAEDLQRLREQVKENSRQLDELADSQTRLYYEYQLQRERDAREREREAHQRDLVTFTREHNLAERELDALKREAELLRRENQLLRERLSLPPAQTEPNED
jgi:hypothetical protein